MQLFKAAELVTFTDARGKIINLIPAGLTFASALYVDGVEGAVRGNHYHAKDSHLSYVLSGRIRYEWEDDGKVSSVELWPGDAVYTRPTEKHRFTFLSDGAFIALATEPRDQTNYENDTYRENF